MLVVGPLSGHFATLLHDMITALVSDHDLYLMDWTDARDVPLSEASGWTTTSPTSWIAWGRWKGEAHLLGICQSAMPALAATALLAERGGPVPQTLTLFDGAMVVALTEIVPVEVRTVGLHPGLQPATALFGGFTPAVSTYLIEAPGNKAAPGLWMSFAAALCRHDDDLSARSRPRGGGTCGTSIAKGGPPTSGSPPSTT